MVFGDKNKNKLTNETNAQIKTENSKFIDNEPLFASYYITLTRRSKMVEISTLFGFFDKSLLLVPRFPPHENY
jgi:hypothetical protein